MLRENYLQQDLVVAHISEGAQERVDVWFCLLLDHQRDNGHKEHPDGGLSQSSTEQRRTRKEEPPHHVVHVVPLPGKWRG